MSSTCSWPPPRRNRRAVTTSGFSVPACVNDVRDAGLALSLSPADMRCAPLAAWDAGAVQHGAGGVWGEQTLHCELLVQPTSDELFCRWGGSQLQAATAVSVFLVSSTERCPLPLFLCSILVFFSLWLLSRELLCT